MSLQLEHKELKKKQRRSERYYTNKQTKDSGSQSTSVHDDDVDMVVDVSLQGELTPDDRSEEGWYKIKLHAHVAHQVREPGVSLSAGHQVCVD